MEHLTDPLPSLESLSKSLAPGGVMIFNSPNPDSLIARKAGSVWLMASLVEHVVFWSPDSVRWLADRLGLKVQRLGHCGTPYPLGRGSGGPGDQGIDHVKELATFATVPKAAPQAHVPNTRSNLQRSLTRALITAAYKFAAPAKDNSLKDLLRWGIRITQTGDHIEAALLKP
jgi:hypothetical protein